MNKQHYAALSLVAAFAMNPIISLAEEDEASTSEEESKPAAEAKVGYFPLEVDPREYLSTIQLPEGFNISIYRDGIEAARSLAVSDSGAVFVGSRTNRKRERIGKVYAVTPGETPAVGGDVKVIASDLNVPNGVALRNGDLYVAEIHRVIRMDAIENNLDSPPEPVVINNSFPEEFHHGWKYLRFGPDDRLYVPIGAPCNICEPEARQGTIVSLAADGTDEQVHAYGVRNSVGFDWDPATGDFWFTDNGRDLWGDDTPPEELNHAPVAGAHFGYPYRYGAALVDDSFDTELTDEAFTGAALEFPAHNALLGMHFYTAQQFPADYHGDIFIASHGSWNREQPDGYKLFRVRMADGEAVAWEEFATGWLTEEGKFWGRPTDVAIAADGALLVSDDFNNLIYRISYGDS
ncbi:MAG: PQQ-dependent sugar dehydrogenase [Halieaceae bacterium]|nr:PQQ-dependent sugar dehydrogenase [Halieaceae bacterium]